MKDLLYEMVGRSAVWCELKLQSVLHSRETLDHRKGGDELDRTGLLVGAAHRLPILWRDEGILYAGYESPAHSFWRAQELSLFHRHRALLEAPVADFGCGDGSFASALFDRIDVGIDNDPEALAIAKGYGIYGRLVQSTQERIPLESASVRTVFSNSVLEHVLRLDEILAELGRVAMPGGRLVFTVPVTTFRSQLARYFGVEESVRVNVQYYHRNLFEPAEWTRRLRSHGFEVERTLHFQPDWFTYWYRMLRFFGRNGLGRVVPGAGEKLWGLCRGALVRMVRGSIRGASTGANIFVVARRS